VVQLDVGNGGRDKQRELPGPCHALGAIGGIKPNRRLHPLAVWRDFWCRRRGRNFTTQGLDGTPGRNVPKTPEHDVEGLVALIATGLGVRVAIDRLQRPFGILELHFLLPFVYLLLPLPLVGGCAILAQLLLHLFTELFRELLDLPALRCGMPRRVMHRALRTTFVTVGRLAGALVTSLATSAPTCCYSGCCRGGCPGQRLATASLLLLLALAANTLSCGAGVGLAHFLACRGSRGLPRTAL
jgi:hypothetical protein